MITFTTDFEINLPVEKEEDYIAQLNSNMDKFLGRETIQPVGEIEIHYVPSNKTNMITFSWKDVSEPDKPDKVFTEEDAVNYAHRMEYWFHHCTFFRQRGIRNFATSYVIKNRG